MSEALSSLRPLSLPHTGESGEVRENEMKDWLLHRGDRQLIFSEFVEVLCTCVCVCVCVCVCNRYAFIYVFIMHRGDRELIFSEFVEVHKLNVCI